MSELFLYFITGLLMLTWLSVVISAIVLIAIYLPWLWTIFFIILLGMTIHD